MRVRHGVWLAALGACSVVAGCGLTLDYGPPDPVGMDASLADGGGLDGGLSCATGCDDGLHCTADTCVAGTCQHADTCPGSTDCVSRGGVGECRRACTDASQCDDHISCTNDLCDAVDGHCAHASTCQDPRPTCLDNGACAPSHCSSDDECSDGDLCDGAERCSDGTCRGGTPVTCAAPTGCRTDVCNPATGTCAPSLDSTLCADGYDCTTDLCSADGSCTHPTSNAACAGRNLCASSSVCYPDASMDSSGCIDLGIMACAAACGASILCDPTTGACDYSLACAVGEVCRSDGCQPIGSCSTDAQCAGIHGPTGCATYCLMGTCQERTCIPPPGGCGVPVLDGGCAPTGGCTFMPDDSLCDDGDPRSHDVCGPDLMCTHMCTPAPADDCVQYTYSGTSCVPSFDSAVCQRLHPTVAGDCAPSTCVGHDAAGTGDANGCAPEPVDALCTDAASCTMDTCSIGGSGRGVCDHTAHDELCDDMMDCTMDTCDPMSAALADPTGCRHQPDDSMCANAAGSLECATAVCAQTGSLANHAGSTLLPTGCALTYQPSACLLGPAICTLDGQCNTVSCSLTRDMCDDGVSCNGRESCGLLGHCQQSLAVIGACSGTLGCSPVCTSVGCVAPTIPACIGIILTP